MERITFEGNFCDIAMCAETSGGSFCEDGACSQRKVWERLKKYEDMIEQGTLLERKQSKWTLIPVNNVAQYICGNIDCCRLIPFGCTPDELTYCPYCGADMRGTTSE